MQIFFTLYAVGAVFACMFFLCLLSCIVVDGVSWLAASWVAPLAESIIASIRKKG